MATISFVIDGEAIDLTVARTIADDDAARIVAFAGAAYPAESPAASLEAMILGTLAGILNNVVAFEREAARQAAEQEVSPIEVSE